MKTVPIRSMSDFLLDSKKYLPPPFNDLKRFNNRVISNLLYYQTNYFVTTGFVFTLFLIFGFNKIIFGAFGVATTSLTVLYFLDRIHYLAPQRARYPASVFGVAAIDLLVVYMTFRPILYFALSLLLPLAFSIIHAAVRSRGLKNKLNNKMGQVGASFVIDSPMSIGLAALGFDIKDYEE